MGGGFDNSHQIAYSYSALGGEGEGKAKGRVGGRRVTKEETFDWIEEHRAEIRYREYLPDGRLTSRPWWVCIEGMNPWSGKTLKGTIGRYAYVHRQVIAKRDAAQKTKERLKEEK